MTFMDERRNSNVPMRKWKVDGYQEGRNNKSRHVPRHPRKRLHFGKGSFKQHDDARVEKECGQFAKHGTIAILFGAFLGNTVNDQGWLIEEHVPDVIMKHPRHGKCEENSNLRWNELQGWITDTILDTDTAERTNCCQIQKTT